MKPKYHVNERIAFVSRNIFIVEGKRNIGKWQHHVGYVKQVRRSLLGFRYIVNVAKSSDVYFVPERDIIGLVANREESN